MKQKDLAPMIAAIVFCAIVAFVLSTLLIKGHSDDRQVKTAGEVSTQFPDVRNDPKYNSIFNKNAIDPAQPIKVDNNNSSTTVPFSGT